MAINYPQRYDDDFLNIIKRIIDELNSMGYTYEESLQKAQDILDEAQSKSNDILDEAERVNALNENVQQQINTLIAESGTSDSEVLQARIDAQGHEYPVLKGRLDTSDEVVVNTERRVKTRATKENISLDVEPVFIRTFDGRNEPIHPSVYYSEEGWNGKKYWMAYTPWPVANVSPYRDRWECPCIVASDNGRDWLIPVGAPDPLADLTASEIENGDYMSDPAIVMNGNTMEVWYRKTKGDNTAITNIFRVTSDDGVNWTSPEMVLDSENTSNGFGEMQTMRSPQVLYENGNYTAFFSMQGLPGSEIWRAETTDPSTGLWNNLEPLTFDGDPAISMWHVGLYKVDGEYHLTGYDSGFNAIHYFKSYDGFDFEFIDTILTAEGNDAVTPGMQTLYQSVPIKVRNEWLLYTSGTLRTSESSKRSIMIHSGPDLSNLTPVQAGLKNIKQYMNFSPVLNNVSGDNTSSQIMYSTYEDVKNNNFSGYKMSFGSSINAPIWRDRFRDRPIVYVFDDTNNPADVPQHVGIVHRNINNGRIWLSVGNASVDDWMELSFSGDMIVKNQRSNFASETEIDVEGVARAVIDQVGSTNEIERLINHRDGQEIWILNPSNNTIILKNNAGGSGSMRLKNREDITLTRYDNVTLIAVGEYFYQK